MTRVTLRGARVPTWVALFILASACHDATKATSGGSDAPPPSASGAPPPVASASASAAPRPPLPPQLCRAISVSGAPKVWFPAGVTSDAGAPGAVVGDGSDIPEEAWVAFDAAGKFTSKHPRSTREMGFIGPGRIRPCVAHGEEAWLERGKIESEPAVGERPGAEEWVITPAGVVRYGGGRVELTVLAATATSGPKVDVKVSSGTAYAWTGDEEGAVKPPPTPAPTPAPSASVRTPNTNDGWTRLEGPRTVSLFVKKPGKPEELAATAVDRCKVEAKSAKDLAASIASPDASLAVIAPRHVVARHLARAACGVAAMRATLLEPSPAREGFLATLKEAEADWKSFRPHGGHGRLH